MSRLTPTKPLKDAQIDAALDILASGQITYKQLGKLISGITLDESQDGFGVDLDELACELDKGHYEWYLSLPVREIPDEPVTVAIGDQPAWRAA